MPDKLKEERFTSAHGFRDLNTFRIEKPWGSSWQEYEVEDVDIRVVQGAENPNLVMAGPNLSKACLLLLIYTSGTYHHPKGPQPHETAPPVRVKT